MSSLAKPVLVLNKMWIPIRVVSVKRCLKLIFADRASIVLPSDYSVHNWDKWAVLPVAEEEEGITTTQGKIKIPEVVVLLNYDKVHRKSLRLTKRNLYIRDGYKCFTPDTLILLGNGRFVPIEKIKVGDDVIDAYGDKQKVEFIHKKKCKEKIYQIRVRGNGDTLNCTADHNILTWNKDLDMVVKKAKKCKKGGFRYGKYGDFLSEIVINDKTFGEKIKNIDVSKYINDLRYLKTEEHYIKHYSGKKIKRKINVNNNFGRLIGYFLSEGSISNDGKQVVFAFNIKEKDFSEEVKTLVEKILGIKCVEKIYKKTNVRVITVCSTVFNAFLKKWCFIEKEKRIVDKNCSISYFKGVLYGLTLGDGNINKILKRTTIMLKTENLIRDIYIISKICKINPLLSKTGHRKDGRIYKSCIYKCSEYNKMKEIIGIKDPYDGLNLNYRIFKKNRVLSPISSIFTVKYDGIVYDLQTSGTHTYVANFICVHNCQYTGKQVSQSKADIDHVIPRSRGGKNSWENMVVCSKELNRAKGNKTPKEAGLKLIKKPGKPSDRQLLFDPKLQIPSSWEKFIGQVG